MDLGDLIGSAAKGGLLGLGGSVATQVIGYFTAKQQAKDALEAKSVDYAHAVEMAKLGQAGADIEAHAAQALAKINGDIANLQASIADQTALGGRVSQWAADALALFRPGLTTLLVLGALAFGLISRTSDAFSALVELAGLSVAWWFGSRDHGKRFKQ
jgi:hypothetical protein